MATMLTRLTRLGLNRRLYSTVTTIPKESHSLQYNGTSFPYRWLRDACQCPECIHPSNRQKLHRTSDVSADISPVSNGVEYSHDGIRINWATGHRSFYPSSLLDSHSSPSKLHEFHRDVDPIIWDAQRLKESKALFVPYNALQNKSGMLDAIEQLTKYGLLFLTGVPNTQTSNQDCELRKLARLFGEIRTTFYGDLWDVKNVRNSKNIAYTNLDLGLHIDLEYFQHPPRYQFLHCLRNRVQGGASLFVDAFDAAYKLRQSHPSEFDILSSTPVNFHYINDGHHLHNSHPTIELSSVSSNPNLPREIKHINYSPPFQAPLSLSTPSEFYPAFERFASLLEQPSARYEYTLREGDAVVFDNRRVLHARTAFTDNANEGEAGSEVNRWLKGCYLEADNVLDQGRTLKEAISN